MEIKKDRKMQNSTAQIAINAMLAALCAVLGYFSLDFVNLKITFESFPVLLAGMMYGPVNGALVGLMGTFIYQLLLYGMELSTPLWILPYVVVGFLIGLYARRSSFNNSKMEISIVMLESELLVFAMNTVSLFLYSKLLYGAFSLPFITGTLFPRFLIALAKGIVYGLITPSILMKLSVITHNGRR